MRFDGVPGRDVDDDGGAETGSPEKKEAVRVKARDFASKAASSITSRLKEIKSGDEHDLGKLAEAFDAVAAEADKTANLLGKADQALAGSDGDSSEEFADETQQDDAKK